ncbi:hypothetical protein [Saccharothrix stipae]
MARSFAHLGCCGSARRTVVNVLGAQEREFRTLRAEHVRSGVGPPGH